MKTAVNRLGGQELTMMIEETFEDILRGAYYEAQVGNFVVLQVFIERVTIGLLGMKSS